MIVGGTLCAGLGVMFELWGLFSVFMRSNNLVSLGPKSYLAEAGVSLTVILRTAAQISAKGFRPTTESGQFHKSLSGNCWSARDRSHVVDCGRAVPRD